MGLHSVKLSKDSVDIINSGIKPMQDDRVRVTLFAGEGAIRVEADDMAVIVRIDVKAQDVKLENGLAEFSFNVSKKVLSSVFDVTVEELVIETDGEAIVFIPDGTVLNMQLTPFDLEIDSSFNSNPAEVIVETKSADTLKDMVTRLGISTPNGKAVIPVIALSKDIRYGSSLNFTVYKRGFDKISVNVVHRFLGYIANLVKFGLNVDFIWDANNNYLVARNDHIVYKTKEIDAEFPDIDAIIASDGMQAGVRLGTQGVGSSLVKLSIPLIGQVDQIVSLSITEDEATQVKVFVKDISNKESYDFWAAIKPTGKADIRLFLQDLKAAADVMDDSFDLAVYERFAELQDESQKTYLVNSIA